MLQRMFMSPSTSSRVAWAGAALYTMLLAAGPVLGQPGENGHIQERARAPFYREQGPLVPSTLYADGSQIMVETESLWHLMCGSDSRGWNADRLRQAAEQNARDMQAPGATIVDNGLRGGGIDLIFQLSNNVPTAAADAIAAAESYIESKFSDPITVRINIDFANMGSGVLGATGSNYTNASYSISRAGLINGRDSDDVLQALMPNASNMPVRYNGSSDSVTQENRIYWTLANYRSTIGSVNGIAASMTFNTQFTWDYDPSNGVIGTSFIDVIVHEVGHALGFTSGADFRNNDMEALDMYRFQRTDGTGNYNPDTELDFQTVPRLVDFNTPNDAHNSDLISVEYRMSDGNPYQASHFREQFQQIGIMDPALGSGETNYPEYFRQADLDMFDAIGYDYPGSEGCPPPAILVQPIAEQQFCAGDIATLSLELAPGETGSFQWRRGDVPLVDDGVHIIGTQTSMMIIIGFTADDAADDYNCLLSSDCGSSVASNNASLTFGAGPEITDQPDDLNANEGDTSSFSVAANGFGFNLSYQWQKDGADLTDDGHILGSNLSQLIIVNTTADDAGQYSCIVSSDEQGSCDIASESATLTVGESACPGDLDGDNDVDQSDLGILLASYEINDGGDIDGDGDTDQADLGALLANYELPCN